MSKPEEMTCPRKKTNCHPLDLIASGDDFTCCGTRDPIGECHRGAVDVFPYCVCVIEPGVDMISCFNRTQLLNALSVVARSLVAVSE